MPTVQPFGVDLNQLLTVLAPQTGPFRGASPAPGQWQIKLGRDRGFGIPLCAIFIPCPPPGGNTNAALQAAQYCLWPGDELNVAFPIPGTLWQSGGGVLPLLLYLQDGQLGGVPYALWRRDLKLNIPVAWVDNALIIEGSSPTPQPTPPRDIADLYKDATDAGAWDALPGNNVPAQSDFDTVLNSKLMSLLQKAMTGPSPVIIHLPRAPASPEPKLGPAAGARQLPDAAQNFARSPQDRDERPRLCFMVGSCAYQGGFVDRALSDPSWAAGPADASLQRLIDWPADQGKPALTHALLLGDQIYSDASAGLFDPRSLDGRFEQPYQDAHSDRFFVAALQRLETHTMIDDHEIEDNYAPLPSASPRQKDSLDAYRAGIQGYKLHQQFSSPGDAPSFDPGDRQTFDLLDDYFIAQGIPFLLLDTRTHRSCRDARDIDTATLLLPAQWGALDHVLQHPPAGAPAFIGTPSMVLPRRLSSETDLPASALLSDAWDGYPAELYRLLARLHRHQAGHVVFLSGDEHLSCIAHFTVTCCTPGHEQKPVQGCSIHSSALYAPYPFANGTRAALRDTDRFEFDDPDTPAMRYCCTVHQTDFAPDGDGFAVLEVNRAANDADPAAWTLDVTFSRADADHPATTIRPAPCPSPAPSAAPSPP